MSRLMTAPEFEQVAGSLGPCELVRGTVQTLAYRRLSEAGVLAKAAEAIREWAKAGDRGRVACEVGLIVQHNPDTVRDAAVAYYSYDRLARSFHSDCYLDVPPNLIVEVVGEGQGWGRLVEKVGDYLRMGVDRVWIIDPKCMRIHVFRSDTEPAVFGNDRILSDDAMPALTLDIAHLFTD